MENWKPVVDFPDYEISDQGNLRRKTEAGWTYLNPSGGEYLMTRLRRGDSWHTRSIHGLVLAAFVGPRGDLQCSHINCNKHDNRLCNLRWTTAKGNAQDRIDWLKSTGQSKTRGVIQMSPVNSLKIRPCELRDANAFIQKLHRHHKPVVGHRFSIAVWDGEVLRGVAVIGRPVARMTDCRTVVEVTRLCTDGTKNVCSMLYSAAARIAKEMGYRLIQTFILESEPGTSLRAAGWVLEGISNGGDWNRPSRMGRRTDQPMVRKMKFSKVLA